MRHGHRFAVADLADQDHVGRLPQGVLQGHVIRLRVGAEFALVDDRLLVLEEELDRVFDGEDVARLVGVAVVDHRGERRRLARAGRAHHQDQPALFHHHFLQHGRQSEGVERRDFAGDVAHHDRGRRALHERADAEAAQAGDRVGRVELEVLLELAHLPFGEDLAHQRADGVRLHDLLVDRHRDAVDLDVDRRADGDEDVGGLLLRHQLEQSLHGHARDPLGRQFGRRERARGSRPGAQPAVFLSRRAAAR